ncbi:hypothetical protein BD309DRAFT_958957 [Dichomitus squalens]|uniref:RING-type E3 ubiquitin transferase n=2 Tax=Dichomitus squalens TaxID=114155 RepID=A0A4Q9NSD6_9APHY|nr:uncharacterized protein DICSQDRAFT_161991 [Dichomitus squalens LYAD-421 SS1]EJF60599.1 hypothetical protein DICSQDRAFT_161991 [Dichomitus squalens LYAD-421 SS1]TBU44208.1 hypothetical protein BD309DRAFT_958957 [Dichomitus squalens]TBU61497.1 hypothetical protein BD310DRAFT_920865 [Dichomitus squalens]
MSTPANDPTRDLENGTDTPSRQQRSSVPSLLFLSFILFMLMNGHGDELANTRDLYVNGLQSLNWQLGNFSAWLNGTESNFTLPVEDPNTTPLVAAFLPFGLELDPKQGSYYSNLTGFWHGDLQLHNLTSLNATEKTSPWRHLAEQWMLTTNLSEIPERLGSWNWTRSNKVTLNVGDKLVPYKQSEEGETKSIAIIHGKVDLAEPKSDDDLRLDFEGVHVLSTGTVYALAVSTGHGIDLRNLPALVPETYRNDSARAVEAEIRIRASKLKEKIDAGSFEQDTSSNEDESPKTKCLFRFFGQLDVTTVPKELMDELENEIDEPTGITTVRAPELSLGGVLLSQDCGILYEIKHTVGVQTQKLYRKITTYAGLSTLVNFLLLVLFRRQAARSSSAAGLSRVSRYTFLIQSLLDAISFVGHVTVAILADGRPSMSVLAPAGLACLLFIYEAQFAVLIGQIQAPEDAPTPRPAAPAPTTAPPPQPQPQVDGSTPTSSGPADQPAPTGVPPVVPTPPPALPERPSFFRFLLHHIRTDPAARLWMMISLCLIVVFRIVIMLSLPLFFIGSLYSCMWLMQIYRSTRRARSSGLSAEYLIGSTLGRLFFVCYFLGCPKNIFDVEPRGWIWFVALIMLLQVFVVFLQEHVDPCFFLPTRVSRVQTYNYHPIIPLPDPEAPEQTLGDCAICMEAILVDPSLRRRSKSSDAKERPAIGLPFLRKVTTARKTYSLAPCHHLFHTECLERWLTYKNICPQCRRPLPPL